MCIYIFKFQTDIENMNLWPKLISFLSFPEISLKMHAIWVCGTAIQNNPRAQKAVRFTPPHPLQFLRSFLNIHVFLKNYLLYQLFIMIVYVYTFLFNYYFT